MTSLPICLNALKQWCVYTHMKSVSETIGAAIAEARQRRNLTQEELGRLCDMQRADVSRLEHGIGNPTIETLTRIFDVLHLKLTVSPL